MPVLIEVVEEKAKLESMLPDIKKIIGDNGLVTLHDLDVL
jgi:PII-like signaling protein